MYTRSYSGGTGKTSALPPDYGGTSLTNGLTKITGTPHQQPIPVSGIEKSSNHSDQSIAPRHPRRATISPGNETTDSQSNEQPETVMRRPGAVISHHFRSTYPLRGPFDFTPPEKEDTEETANTENAKQTSENVLPQPVTRDEHAGDDIENGKPFGGIFPKAGMNSDDLLLLGLLFLFWNEDKAGGDGCREAMMLLALLYLSGI